MPTYNLTQLDIQKALGLSVRVLSDEQIASGWFGDVAAVDEVHALMEPMCSIGFVERREIYSHPILNMAEPVAHWRPGDAAPTEEEIKALAAFFGSRWTEDDEQRFVVYVATRLGAGYVGSHLLEPPNEEQWTHDLHVAQLFVQLRQANSIDEMRFVVGEGAFEKRGFDIAKFKDLDLFVVDEHRQAQQILEHAGSYDAQHIREIHEHCSGGAYEKLVKRYPNREHRLYPDPCGTEYLLY